MPADTEYGRHLDREAAIRRAFEAKKWAIERVSFTLSNEDRGDTEKLISAASKLEAYVLSEAVGRPAGLDGFHALKLGQDASVSEDGNLLADVGTVRSDDSSGQDSSDIHPIA